MRHAKKLGGCLKIAYLSFGWGQTAQLPQILAGFGIDFVFVGKNVNKERALRSEFFWRAPDGTRLLATRLGVGGRANSCQRESKPIALFKQKSRLRMAK